MSSKMFDANNGFYADQVKAMSEAVGKGTWPESPAFTISALESELAQLRKDNALLIEMNFNLEQQVSALKEDLEQANDLCLEWSDQCHELEDQINELMAALLTIKGITDEHG
jgi:chromosome segregation ATPase